MFVFVVVKVIVFRKSTKTIYLNLLITVIINGVHVVRNL